jgi:hypothetical protein
MKKILLITLITCFLTGSLDLLLASQDHVFYPPKTGESVLGTYSGSSPCGNFIKPLLNIPLNEDCDRIKWNITLYRDSKTHQPTTFKLSCIFGMQEQGGPGFIGGGKRVEAGGRWIITKGTKANRNAVVYQLNLKKDKSAIFFVKMDDNILHLLYSDKSLMIGNSGWSYTLNRIDN